MRVRQVRVAILAVLAFIAATEAAVAQQAPAARPGPVVDHVGYPADYQTTYTPLYAFDRADNKQVRVVLGNDAAAGAQAGQPFAYGSIIVMETYRAVLDDQGNPV